ncbi:MAG: hypothetical protein AAF992_12980 [Bacteroidota bacterium]
MKTSKKWAWLTMLLTGMLSVGITSCDEDDNNTVTPDPSDGQEAESAYFFGYRDFTPQGSVYYIEVQEEIGSGTNKSNAVEIGLNAYVTSYGEHPYSFNGNAGTITKWDVDKTTLELSPSAILSLAGSTGLSGSVRPVFLSETRAFINKLEEGLIVEWNPSTMDITEVYNVDPLPDLGAEVVAYRQHSGYISSEGKIILPVWVAEPANCCETSHLPQPPHSLVAVFDPETGTLQYNRDSRQYANEGTLLQDPVDGSYYLYPASRNDFIEPYFVTEGLPDLRSVLKINQDGSFDPNFHFDISEVIGATYQRSANFVYDGKMAYNYVDTADYTYPDAYTERTEIWSVNGPLLRKVLIDLNTGEVTPFTGLDDYSGSFQVNTINGVAYFSASNSDNDVYSIVRQDGANEFTPLTTRSEGNFMSFGQLW